MTHSAKARSALAGRLRRDMEGDVHFDEFSRGRYATDASPFQTFPLAVVLPKTQADLLAIMRLAWEAGVPVIARGGGTGRAGQAVGEGLVVDFSKYLTRLLYYDASARTCIVEPGITPAALNTALKPERVWFPVDIASAAQATIGGMSGSDAIGSRTLRYGRMRDNIVACDGILADGSEISFGEIPEDFGESAAEGGEAGLVLDLLEAAENAETIIQVLPNIGGGLTGYNVRALLAGDAPQNLAAFLTGSEGTLAIAKSIELKLTRRPRSRALGVCHFPSLSDALGATPEIVALGPTGVELTGPRIMDLGSQGQDSEPVRRILRRDAEALLFVEFMESNRVANARKLKDLADLLAQLGYPRSVSEVIGPAAQEGVRRVHRDGLARLYGRTSLPAAFAPVAEFALPLSQIAAASAEIIAVLSRHGWDVIWHGHVGVGAVYMRPWLPANGQAASEAAAVAEDVSAAFANFADHLTSVEGQGIARSYAAEATRPAKLTRLLEQIKTRFDPKNRLNPGKIVFPARPGPQSLRTQPPREAPSVLAALNCDGTALCRRLDAGLMCPSFRLTREERDSPRGRANTLRLALAGDLGPHALASDAMAETMALCASCKACRSECPRAVDIAQARIAVQKARLERVGPSKFEQTAAFLPHRAPRLRAWRHLLNLRDILPWTARLSETLTGISADRPWPHWSASPFAGHAFNGGGKTGGPEILLFPDTFNSYFDPVTLRAAADVLSASGFHLHILVPPPGERPYCCGRTFLEMGLVEEARREARRLIAAARPFTERGIPLVGLEPACVLTIRDEFVTQLAVDGAPELASATSLFEEVMSEPAAAQALTPRLLKIEAEILFSAHCHQHAFGTAGLARQVAAMVPGTIVIEAEKACCGMGTTFGYRPEAVSSSLGMGELSLFPQIRRTGRNTLLVADGFACRKQIADGTGRTARHSAVLLKLALAAKQKFGREWNDGSANDGKLARRLTRLRKDYFR